MEPNRRREFSTAREVELATPGRSRDLKSTGLYLYVTPDERTRRWIFRYTRPRKGGVTETGLGIYPVVSLAMARAEVLKKQRLIATGVDPIQRKREDRAAETTFAEAANGWIDTHKIEWRGGDEGSQMRNAKLLLHHHGAPLSGKPVSEITADLIESTLTDLWARSPAQARRALGMFERVLDYARAKGLRTGDNPANWRGMHEYRFPRRRKAERAHLAAMPYDAVPEFILALRQRQGRSTAATALEFLILTAARSGEVLNATWSEIDFDQKLWTIPATRTKQRREHRIPLPDRAMALLTRQREQSRGSPYVFTGYRPNDPLAEKAMIWALRHVGSSATVHGFRSSFRDWAGDTTTFQRETIEECLGHSVGNEVERAYRRQDGLEKRRAIMGAWEAYCAGSGQSPVTAGQ